MILDDVRDFLVANGAATVLWPLTIGYLPDDSDQAIMLTEYPGIPRDTLGGENENPKFQLRVRGMKLDYPTARAKWLECFNLLQDSRQTSGSPVLLPGVVFIQSMGDGPFAINDEKGRPNFSTNFRCKRYR